MKTKKNFLICLFCSLCLVLSLSSCVTAGAVIKSNFEGLPVWYYIPESQVKKGKTVFLGEGKAETQRQARLLAFSNLFDNIEAYFGRDLDEEYYRELSVLQSIDSYGLYVNDTDISYENGVYTVLLRATADTQLIEKLRTTAVLEKQKTLEHIYSLADEAVGYMKSGMDLSAAQKYMEAMLLVWDNPEVKEFYSFEALMNECIQIINSVSLKLIETSPISAECKIEASVQEGKLTSLISYCPILATYKAVGVNGNEYTDSFPCRTNEQGILDFKSHNSSLKKRGIIKFTLNIEDSIKLLEEKAGKEAVASLRAAFDRKSIYFDYDLLYTNKVVGLAIMNYDGSGDESDSTYLTEYFEKKYKDCSIKTKRAIADNSMEDSDIVKKYMSSNNDGYLFISRISQTETIKSETGPYMVSCEGSFSIYDAKTGELLKDSGIVYSSDFGDSPKEALEGSLAKLADLFFALVRSVYV